MNSTLLNTKPPEENEGIVFVLSIDFLELSLTAGLVLEGVVEYFDEIPRRPLT